MISLRWTVTLALGVVAVTVILVTDFALISFPASDDIKIGRNTGADSVQISSETVALAPGELPGYTGWARPEATLAGFFSIVSLSTHEPMVGKEFAVTLQCNLHEECLNGSSLFYLRAYGPSVIPGVVKNEGLGKYTLIFVFPDPGRYTVEAVLTFSNPPSLEKFPLTTEQEEPAYEGYLVPGFPVQVEVQNALSHSTSTTGTRVPICTSGDLLETSGTSSVLKARWMVVRRNNAPGHHATSSKITKSGILRNANSLGIQMEYDFVSDCALLPAASFTVSAGDKHPFSKCGGKQIHAIFIGDSVMRAQWEMFKTMTENFPNVGSSYVTLYGGFRRVTKLDKDTLRTKLNDIQDRYGDAVKAVLFNSGLHDIHRLCGSEWRQDRLEYLDNSLLESGKFSCINEYNALIHDFATMIKSYDAEFKVFQSTTAAWPKYGNFGVDWPMGGQLMPMATDVIPFFNDIAYGILKDNFLEIDLMDGYWITYSRPDNREVGTVGSKLSHPGLEVLSAMARIWSMLILQRACGGTD